MRALLVIDILLWIFLVGASSGNLLHRCETESIIEAIEDARLSEAREIALELLWNHPDCEKYISRSYAQAADAKLSPKDEYYLDRVDAASSLTPGATRRRPLVRRDGDQCWVGSSSKEASVAWDQCCSMLPSDDALGDLTEADCIGGTEGLWLCCDFFHGSPSYLRLPALRELALNVRISFDDGEEVVLELEQDGFLRSFDTAAVLWPGGYLLTLCVATPAKCGVPELLRAANYAASRHSPIRPLAVELGAGIGAPSIALALVLRKVVVEDDREETKVLVVATDWAPHALALTIANKNANDRAPITVMRVDHTNGTSLSELRRRFFPHDDAGGFAIVLGSSLQAFFDKTEDSNSALWMALGVLLDPNNREAVALLAHTKAEPVQPPKDGSFRVVRRISGDIFDMETWSGASSDFVISVFQRSVGGNEL